MRTYEFPSSISVYDSITDEFILEGSAMITETYENIDVDGNTWRAIVTTIGMETTVWCYCSLDTTGEAYEVNSFDSDDCAWALTLQEMRNDGYTLVSVTDGW